MPHDNGCPGNHNEAHAGAKTHCENLAFAYDAYISTVY